MRLGERRQRRAQARAGERRQRRLDEQHIGGGDHELGARQVRQRGRHGAAALEHAALVVQQLELEHAFGAELGERAERDAQRLHPDSFIHRSSRRLASRLRSARAVRRAGP